MSHGVRDICEGLIREYLVKKGLHATVDAFNREQPKHAESITKRDTLRKSIGVDNFASKWKRANPNAETLPTTLELLAEQQARAVAREEREQQRDMQNNYFQQEPSKPSPRAVNRSSARYAEEEPEEMSMPEGASMGGLRSAGGRAASLGVGRADSGPSAAFGFSPEPANPSNITRRVAAMSMEAQEEPDSGSMPVGPGGASRRGATPVGYGAGSVRALEPYSIPAPAPAPAPPAAAPPPSRAPGPAPSSVPVRGSQPGPRRAGGEMLMEDIADEDLGFEEPLPVPGAGAIGRSAAARGSVAAVKGSQVPPDLIRNMNALLWGSHGQPPPSWKQGFFFNTNPGLTFGLTQSQGGPCGVLAAVQAHILAALHSPAGFSMNPGRSEQQAALVAALTEALWQARMGSAAYVVVPSQESGAGGSGMGYDNMARSITSLSANSKEALSSSVRTAIASYAEPGGWGVCLFLFSLLMSRGISTIQKDMDEPSNSLMGMHGYCTQELVNMIITGQAVSNVFDGNRDLDGSILRGITRQCKLGLLTLFEWYKYVEVGQCLKSPDLPIWVVCSESHFTVLFANDSKVLRGKPPFDLYYYDELANQEAIIRLSLTSDPEGGWTAKVGSSFGDRGKCEGQNIPPLECVIETRWPGVKINWNGSEPIL